jgi:hypothetical protein
VVARRSAIPYLVSAAWQRPDRMGRKGNHFWLPPESGSENRDRICTVFGGTLGAARMDARVGDQVDRTPYMATNSCHVPMK